MMFSQADVGEKARRMAGGCPECSSPIWLLALFRQRYFLRKLCIDNQPDYSRHNLQNSPRVTTPGTNRYPAVVIHQTRVGRTVQFAIGQP